MTPPTCANCKYSIPLGQEQGECHRHVPSVQLIPVQGSGLIRDAKRGDMGANLLPVTFWPIIHPGHWCGEHSWKDGVQLQETIKETLRNANDN